MEYARTIPDSISKELKRRTSAISRHDASEFCETIAPSDHQRAQGMPGAQCTRSLVCAGVVEYAHEYSQRRHRIHPAFPTQWFYGLYRALPGDRALLPPSFRKE
jgi:hypothetical protein